MSQEAFCWLGEKGRLEPLLLESLFTSRTVMILQDRGYAGTRKKKIQYYCCPSNLSLFPLNLLLPNTDLFVLFYFWSILRQGYP